LAEHRPLGEDCNDTTRAPRLSNDGQVALAVSIAPYSIQSMWGDTRYDVYVVDPPTISGSW